MVSIATTIYHPIYPSTQHIMVVDGNHTSTHIQGNKNKSYIRTNEPFIYNTQYNINQ
jgi:hypothetical protein